MLGKATLGLGPNILGPRLRLEPDRIITLVFMENDSSHRVVMGKSLDHSKAFFYLMDFPHSWVIWTVRKTSSMSLMCSNFRQIPSPATMLATLEHLKI